MVDFAHRQVLKVLILNALSPPHACPGGRSESHCFIFFLLFGEIVLKIPIFIVKLSEKMLDSSLRSMSNFVAISETESYDER